jgi:hypothetical protein
VVLLTLLLVGRPAGSMIASPYDSTSNFLINHNGWAVLWLQCQYTNKHINIFLHGGY